MTEPRTAAGRALLDEMMAEVPPNSPERTGRIRGSLAASILAIEAEARAAALDDVLTALDERIPPMEWPDGFADKVLAAIDALRERA